MKEVTLVFPHQLFEQNPAVKKGREIFLVEEFLFFRQYKFHKQKLIFQRASMKFYEKYLKDFGNNVNYIVSGEEHSDVRKLVEYLGKKGVKTVHYCDVTDDWLGRRIKEYCAKYGIETRVYETPMFLNSRKYNEEYFKGRKRFFQTDFYVSQRKRLGILMDDGGKPAGGKWSFDEENRKKYPRGKTPPATRHCRENGFLKEARDYVQNNFTDNYGSAEGETIFPVTFEASKAWFEDFLKERFGEFGVYEDAIVEGEAFLNHSGISPMLNAGLLTPEYIVKRTLECIENNDIPLNSVEGFIRQMIGWREFMRAVYDLRGSEQRNKNFWRFKRRMPESFWSGNTGIAPFDSVVKKVLKRGYCHHIERLMVLGNFMVLCEIHPDDVYRWFMEMFVDAYDWVMVTNVYGMSQFADGGIVSTKPYISGSNYLIKMSDFKKGEWQETWDSLFWNFLDKHRNFFMKNPRLGMLIKTFDKMDSARKTTLLNRAEEFLKGL